MDVFREIRGLARVVRQPPCGNASHFGVGRLQAFRQKTQTNYCMLSRGAHFREEDDKATGRCSIYVVQRCQIKKNLEAHLSSYVYTFNHAVQVVLVFQMLIA